MKGTLSLSNLRNKIRKLLALFLIILLIRCCVGKIYNPDIPVYFEQKPVIDDLVDSTEPNKSLSEEPEAPADEFEVGFDENLFQDGEVSEDTLVPVPIFLKGRQLGEIQIFLSKSFWYIHKGSLDKFIETFKVIPNYNKEDLVVYFQQEFIKVNSNEFKLNSSYSFDFDRNLLIINIIVGEIFRKKSVSFNEMKRFFEEKFDTEQPKDRFTFVNEILFRQSVSISEKNDQIYGTKYFPYYSIAINSLLNVDQIIAESSVFYNSLVKTFDKNFVRISKPIESLKSTISIGDIFVRQNQFSRMSGAANLTGVAVFNNQFLNSTRVGSISIAGKFSVNERSTVEVLRGEKVIYSSIYNKGEYTLTDIPLALGDNDIKLKITNESTGEVTIIPVEDEFVSNRLIVKDKIDYIFGAGEIFGSIKKGIPLFFGNFEKRVSDYSSIYVGIKSDLDKTLLDVGTSIDTNSFYSDIGISKDLSSKEFSVLTTIDPKIKDKFYDLRFSYLHFSEGYTGIGAGNSIDSLFSGVTIGGSFKLSKQTRANLRIGHSLNLNGSTSSLSGGINQRIGKNVNISFNGGISKRNEQINSMMFLGLNINLSPETRSISTLSTDRFSSTVINNSKSGIYSANYTKKEQDIVSANMSKQYSSFFLLGTAQSNLTNSTSNLSLGVNTALILTESAFAINKPVFGNSFVLVKPEERDFDFSVEKAEKNITGNIVKVVSPYQRGNVLVEPYLTDGLYLEKDFFTYKVPEKGSSTIKLPISKKMEISGTLLSENNKPLSLYEGRVRFGEKFFEFITGDTGEFTVELLGLEEKSSTEVELELILLSFKDKVKKLLLNISKDENGKDIGEVVFPVYMKD